MTSFSFNFSLDSKGELNNTKNPDSMVNCSSETPTVPAALIGESVTDAPTLVEENRVPVATLPARLLVLDDPQKIVDMNVPSFETVVRCHGSAAENAIKFLCADPDRVDLSDNLVSALSDTPSSSSSGSTTDLIPGVYEGGLRVWEASVDLVKYMMTHPEVLAISTPNGLGSRNERQASRPKQCLELGAGHGFPGLFVLKQEEKAWSVVFSDFNEEVLTSVTWPNVLMNTKADARFRASYVAGDWNSLRPIVEDVTKTKLSRDEVNAELNTLVSSIETQEITKPVRITSVEEPLNGGDSQCSSDRYGIFDLILTAETCYTERSCSEVARIIADLLKDSRTAVALVASKRFYFGTGGSASCFRREAEALGLHVSVKDIIDDGRSNIREVMEVRKISFL